MADDRRVRDYVNFGTPSDVSAHLVEVCGRFEHLANDIWTKTHLQEAARVFPNMLRCIARQLRILGASMDLPIEVAAGACRTVFELNVRTRLMTAHPDRIREFWVERVFEEISLIEAFKRLCDSGTSERTLKALNDRIEELRGYATKWKLVKPSVESSFKMAELAGEADEYKALYGFYSKYTHGTAWLVNAKDGERDGEGYRTIFLVQTQLYAFDAYKRIEDFVHESEQQA
jgi:hypothetical protein